MPAPHGFATDLDTVQKQIGWLKRYVNRNDIPASKVLSTLILSEYTTLNTALQAVTSNIQLYADPTLALRFDITPDPGIAPGVSSIPTTFTGGA